METLLTIASITINTLLWIAIYHYTKKTSLSVSRVLFVRIKSGIILAAWAATILLLAHSNFFSEGGQPPRIAIAQLSILLIGLLLLFSKTFKAVLRAIPLYWTVGVQAFRILGGLFIVAHFQGKIPGSFAYPVGIGDILVGITAPFVAYAYYKDKEKARPYVYAWNIFGVLDFFDALALGSIISPSAITTLPLVIIPAFGVPRNFALHMYTFWQLRKNGQDRILAEA